MTFLDYSTDKFNEAKTKCAAPSSEKFTFEEAVPAPDYDISQLESILESSIDPDQPELTFYLDDVIANKEMFVL